MAEDIKTFLSAFQKVKSSNNRNPDQYVALCPAHDDHKQSLMIKDDTANTGRILIHCQAGCRCEDILSAVGKDWLASQLGGESMSAHSGVEVDR